MKRLDKSWLKAPKDKMNGNDETDDENEAHGKDGKKKVNIKKEVNEIFIANLTEDLTIKMMADDENNDDLVKR